MVLKAFNSAFSSCLNLQPLLALIIIFPYSASTYSADLNPNTYPVISIPFDPQQEVSHYSMSMEENPPRDLPKKVFKKLWVKKGETLKIKSYVISELLLSKMTGLTRGTDDIQITEVENLIDTTDRKKFLNLLVSLSQERRHAETEEEWGAIIKNFGGSDRRARLNPSLYPTPYLEVADVPNGDPQIRYFVPVAEVLSGAGELDLQEAKIKVITGLSLLMMNEFSKDDQSHGKEKISASVKKMANQIPNVCTAANCLWSKESPVGVLLTDLHKIYSTGTTLDLKKESFSELQLRKQICLIQLLHEFCPGFKAWDPIQEISQTEKLDCRERDSILQGLEK